jgi:hypothetical protein
MSDPISLIGLVASVLQLIDAAVKVSDYLSDVKNASREQQQLSNEVACLESLLEELKQISDQGVVHVTGPGDPRIRDMKHLETTLTECVDKLNALKAKLETARKFWKRLLWTKYKAEIKDMLATIERFKALLGSWLHLDTWYESPISNIFLDSCTLGILPENSKSIETVSRQLL